ncbi:MULTISPECIES: hypothetical protein [Bacillus cereus group]|nr:MULTISPECIES: hypothetical protein [Bacillus cereus group]KZE04204.1 hypothetical protein B4117_4272 [Bacillus mycoides]
MLIRKNYKARDTAFGSTILARKFGVSPKAVEDIAKGITWKYI